MNILHVISSTNPQGGGPIAGLKQLFSQYELLSISAEIACCDAPDSVWLSAEKLPTIHALGPSNGSYAYTPNLLPWLRKNASRFDAVIIDGIWQYHSLATGLALRGSKVPYYVFTHGMLGPWFKIHHPIKHLKKWLYWPWADYRVLRNAKAVLFTCNEERLLARESFWLYKANEKIAGFGTAPPPNYSDNSLKKFLNTYSELKDKRIVLFVGRMHKIKGCDLLIEAFARTAKKHDDLHLLMVGPDQSSWALELKEQAKNLDISLRITWTGMLQGDDKWSAFHAAEVFCLPSHHENFGVVVAEALVCGKPVLISNKVNIWREIESDAAGFVDDNTVEGTVRNLDRWLALNSDSYNEMAEKAEQCFAQRFHIRRAAERLVEIIKENHHKN